jgi:hypothetical protein
VISQSIKMIRIKRNSECDCLCASLVPDLNLSLCCRLDTTARMINAVTHIANSKAKRSQAVSLASADSRNGGSSMVLIDRRRFQQCEGAFAFAWSFSRCDTAHQCEVAPVFILDLLPRVAPRRRALQKLHNGFSRSTSIAAFR